MPVISISVENKIAEADGTIYVCGNSDFVAKFAFDAEWEAYETKTARFGYNNSYVDVVFTGSECPVPIISGTYFFNIGVYAGNLHTTTPARVPCKKSILCDTGFPADPPNDVYNQIMEKLNSLGSADPEAIAKAVANYLAEHPVEETDPTVPEWAKAETKPTYTADEVGAISQDDLQTATNNALAQAKASGEFDGPAGAPGKDGAGMDITGATVGQIAKITAVDTDGKPTAWEAVDMPSGGSGETWEKVAEVTTTEVVTSLRVTFDACKAVYVEYQWGGVEDSLGNIYIAPNVGDTFYTAESRAAAVKLTTSTNNKRGYTFVTIDTRMGSKWVAKSGTLSRGDGTFGDITPGDDMNCNIGAAGNCLFSKMSESYFDAGGKQLSDGVKSITAYGAGMAIGTTLSVWGIKK